MRRLVLPVLAWLAVTAAAVAVAWAGVAIVTARVVEPLPSSALAAATGNGGRAVTEPGDGAATTPAPVTSATPGVGATSPAPEGSTAADDGDQDDESPGGADGPAEAASDALRTYRVVGGTVTLRFAPGAVTVVAAVPADDDVDLDLEGNGTAEATVEFESDDHRSRVRGWWERGPRDRVEEQPRSDADGDLDDDRGDGDDDGADD